MNVNGVGSRSAVVLVLGEPEHQWCMALGPNGIVIYGQRWQTMYRASYDCGNEILTTIQCVI